MIYLDAAYIAKFYVDEPDSERVRAFLVTAQPAASCVHAIGKRETGETGSALELRSFCHARLPIAFAPVTVIEKAIHGSLIFNACFAGHGHVRFLSNRPPPARADF